MLHSGSGNFGSDQDNVQWKEAKIVCLKKDAVSEGPNDTRKGIDQEPFFGKEEALC